MMILPSSVDGLSDAELIDFQAMVQQWESKQERNALRTEYYLGHNLLDDLGIAIPPFLKNTETVVGWPAKAVDALVERSKFDRFVAPGSDDDPLGLREDLSRNGFSELYRQAVRAQLIHSVVFWTVTGTKSRVNVSVRTADMATALWDYETQRVRCGMAITDFDVAPGGNKSPSKLVLFFIDRTVYLERDGSQWAVTGEHSHAVGRPLIVPMAFEPSEMRPFGRSRITREVMSLTDSAQRAALRMEVLMEFNTAPQKFLLGAEEDAFKHGKWKAYLSEILAISRDEDGQLPSFGQLPQVSPQGAIAYYGHLAARFAGATGLPLSSLGVVHENPASAEAIMSAKDDLFTIAEALNAGNSLALVEVGRLLYAVQATIEYGELPDEALMLEAHFSSVRNPSLVSSGDAVAKIVPAIPYLADTTWILEQLGMDESDIVRVLADKRKAEAGSMLDRVLESRKSVTVDVDSGPTTAEV